MKGGSTLCCVRDQGRQGRRVPLPQRAEADRHHQQSRRRQEPGHPSGDDDASAADAGAARRARHRRRVGAVFGRARTSRRHDRGFADGAGRGLVASKNGVGDRAAPTRTRARRGFGDCDAEAFGQAGIAPVVHVQSVGRHERRRMPSDRPRASAASSRSVEQVDIFPLGGERDQRDHRAASGLAITFGANCGSIRTTSAPVARILFEAGANRRRRDRRADDRGSRNWCRAATAQGRACGDHRAVEAR